MLTAEAIKRTRTAMGFSIRELGRRAGVSAAQISRIEAGEVDQPSLDTLVELARALDRNPKPLLIVSGYVELEDARRTLKEMFRENQGSSYDTAVDSELVEVWHHYGQDDELVKARKLLADPDASEEQIRELAVEVFLTAETDETLWDSWLNAVTGDAPGPELQLLINHWRTLTPRRKQRVLEFVADQAALSDYEQAESTSIGGGTDGDA